MFGYSTSTTVALLLDLGELAGDVRGVAVQHRRVPVADLPRVVQHDHLHTHKPTYTYTSTCGRYNDHDTGVSLR